MTDNFFEEICEKYYKDVYKYIYFSLPDKQSAEDIVQEVFIIVYKNIDSLAKHRNIGGYIFKTANNLVKNHKKQLYKKLTRELSAENELIYLTDPTSDPETVLDRRINEYELIPKILSRLSAEKQNLYSLFYKQKKPMHQISQELGISYAAARMKYVRLRRELKEIIKEFSDEI